jgi:flagellar biosynthesis activator protein FlaF
MSQGVSAYAKAAKVTQSPRELEASLLIRSALRLQGIQDAWEEKQNDLDAALLYNRKLWTILVASVTRPDNPLPAPIRQNIANIGLFIFNQTLKTIAEPSPDKLGSMVFINKELAAGLNARTTERQETSDRS